MKLLNKRLAALAVVCLLIGAPALAAFALWTDPTATSSGTRAAPTLVTEGMSLNGVRAFRVIVSAASGQTLSGGGNMRAWVWQNAHGRWARNTQLDFAVNPTIATTRDFAAPDFAVGVGDARVLFQADAVTSSSGEITTQIQAW